MHSADEILKILDDCAASYDFPMLDNGYLHLADTRLTALRGDVDWCLVIETVCVFNRLVDPAESICNWMYYFGNCLTEPDVSDYVSQEAWQTAIDNHPHDDSQVLSPISALDEPLLDDETSNLSRTVKKLQLRETEIAICRDPSTYAEHGILLRSPDAVESHELLRLLICTQRERLLATPSELWDKIDRPIHSLNTLLQLDAWRHPDLADDELPSETEAFRMIAAAIAANDPTRYAPTQAPNTHWANWPTGGTL